MAGALDALQQVQMGAAEPCVDSYIFVDAAGAAIYPLLRTVETLFTHCGSAQEAFQSVMLQRTLASACTDGKLQLRDIDMLSCQFMSSNFVSYDGTPDALRVFDFLRLLVRAGMIAFPGTEPCVALSQLLENIGFPSAAPSS